MQLDHFTVQKGMFGAQYKKKCYGNEDSAVGTLHCKEIFFNTKKFLKVTLGMASANENF